MMGEVVSVKQFVCALEELNNNRLRWMMFGVVYAHRTDKGNGLKTILRTSLVETTDLWTEEEEEEEEGVLNPKESFRVMPRPPPPPVSESSRVEVDQSSMNRLYGAYTNAVCEPNQSLGTSV